MDRQIAVELNHVEVGLDPRAVAFELKGVVASLTVLRLRTLDLGRIEHDLRSRIERVPHLFLNAPVVLDVAELDPQGPLNLFPLALLLRSCKLLPVAVTNLPAASLDSALAAGLGVLQLSASRTRSSAAQSVGPNHLPSGRGAVVAESPMIDETRREGALAALVSAGPAAPPTKSPSAAGPFAGSLTIKQPVRGGQVVYAQNSDLVVLAPVNVGAQVIADGHVHIYGPLRGRALAGAQGMTEARVFCQVLDAELVSVAGSYLLADQIPEAGRGKSAQVFLENGRCKITSL